MANGYSREQIIGKVKEYFRNKGFHTEEYSVMWRDEIRLPLYCKKRWTDQNGEENIEEVVVDIIAESTISKDQYLPPITEHGVTIPDACPPRFFQYYLPRAKVYWAYGSHVSKDEGYEHFVKACVKHGIGLIEVSRTRVDIIQDADTLVEGFQKRVEEVTVDVKSLQDRSKRKVEESRNTLLKQSDFVNRMRLLADMFCEEYIHRLIYYGDPVFRRQEIVGRYAQKVSLLLIDELPELRNLQYKDILINMANGYRKETREDYKIALDIIQSLWKSRLDMEYPDVQKNFEAVLQLNPKYRDHFLHEFQVFLLGAAIIDHLYQTKPVRSFEKLSGSTLEDAWLAASTYHDFNYAIQNCEEWMKDFFTQFLNIEDCRPVSLNLEGVVVRDDFLSKLKGICDAINYELDDCMVRFIFEKAVEERNHAAIATLTFLNRFESNNRLTKPAINQAALAILLHEESNWSSFSGRHDCTRPWEVALAGKSIMDNLTFDLLPLAFLLAYCDVAQEWGRVGRNYETAKPELVDITINNKRILVGVQVEDQVSFTDKRKEIRKLQQFLKDDRFILRIQSRTGSCDELKMKGKQV